jgi:hypothetical protein
MAGNRRERPKISRSTTALATLTPANIDHGDFL